VELVRMNFSLILPVKLVETTVKLVLLLTNVLSVILVMSKSEVPVKHVPKTVLPVLRKIHAILMDVLLLSFI
jgi:hypothetical protein